MSPNVTDRLGVALLTVGHAVDDLYQGAVPALLPFLVAERHYSYAAASGLVLAANLLASIAQPAFGAITDKLHLTWLAIALSGLGVAAFHPEAARSARIASGGSQTAMSWFGVGGNLGLTFGPLLATPVLLAVGVRGTAVLAIPAVLFFGLTSFLALYVSSSLGGSKTLGEIALALFLGFGALGALIGGHLADSFGRLPVTRAGYALAIPSLAGLVLSGRPRVFGFIVLTAVTVYLPFSIQVTLGQDYLPNRVGTASGVSLGLAITVGGLLAPVFGLLADATSLRLTLTVLIALPVLALLLTATMRDPRPRSPEPATGATAAAVGRAGSGRTGRGR